MAPVGQENNIVVDKIHAYTLKNFQKLEPEDSQVFNEIFEKNLKQTWIKICRTL